MKIDHIEYYRENGRWYRKTFYCGTSSPTVEKVKTPLPLYDDKGKLMIVLKDEEGAGE